MNVRFARPRGLLGLLTFVLAGCKGASVPTSSADARVADAGIPGEQLDASTGELDSSLTEDAALPDVAHEPEKPRLTSESPYVLLEVPKHGQAVASLPLGTSEPLPVLVATHGNYDTPESQCAVWRAIVGNRAFVLCPRGVARDDSPSKTDLRYHYLTNQALEKELDAAAASLKQAYGDFVSEGPMIYAGFSQGAIMGVAILQRTPSKYRRAVLIEGGNKGWSVKKTRAFAEAGQLADAPRVMFACGQGACLAPSKESAKLFEKAGVQTKVVFSKNQGHTYGEGVAEEIAKEVDWILGE